jgi:ApbE superfamily uncharacterized protein (UPF0280 family)
VSTPGAVRARLEGARLHFQHGPIDLLIDAEGDADCVARAHEAAWSRFEGLLPELVAELPLLRTPVAARGTCPLKGTVAAAMWRACRPFRHPFITPMAAVAGAVADEVIGFYRTPGIAKAVVNNGGDIAVHLAAGRSARIAVVPRIDAPGAMHDARGRLEFVMEAGAPSRGVATSGWRGRSFSLGIADSVTVLAATAAQADAAATVIANAVNLDHPGIVRRPARELQPDSDLGGIQVTVAVPRLDLRHVEAALDSGLARAQALASQGCIHAAFLVCQERVRSAGSTRLGAMKQDSES